MSAQPTHHLLLAHHPETELERCSQVKGYWICRRCLTLYPLTLAVLVGDLLAQLPLQPLEPLLALLPLPATADFVLNQVGLIRYNAARVIAGSILLSLALGHGFARYCLHPLDGWFWSLVLGYGLPTVAALLYRRLQPPA